MAFYCLCYNLNLISEHNRANYLVISASARLELLRETKSIRRWC